MEDAGFVLVSYVVTFGGDRRLLAWRDRSTRPAAAAPLADDADKHLDRDAHR